MVAAIPQLRAFAVSLCGDPDRADDLVEEALSEALPMIGSHARGTSLLAWLLTTLRDAYYPELGERRAEAAGTEGRPPRASVSSQDVCPEYLDFRGVL